MMTGERAAGTGWDRVDTDVSCVITRFNLRSMFLLPIFFLAFYQIKREAILKVPGLLKSVFVIESPRIFYTISMWRDDQSIRTFNKLASHVMTATWSGRHLVRKPRMQVWSAHWKLHAISRNQGWSNFDLRAVVDESHLSHPAGSV